MGLEERGEADFMAFNEAEELGLDLRRYWWILQKNLVLALAVPLVFVAIVALRDLMATPLYTATAIVLIHSNGPAIFDPTALSPSVRGGEDVGDGSSSETDYETQYELLRSRSLATAVIMSEGLANDSTFTGTDPGSPRRTTTTLTRASLDNLVNGYLSSLKITPVEKTRLVRVGFTTRHPELSARLANAHVQQFINQGIALNAQTSDEAARFLQQKLAQIKAQLQESELALNNYRRDKGIIPGLISLNGSQDVVLGRLDKLSGQVQDAHLKVIELGTQLTLIDRGRADALAAVIDSGLVQRLRGELDSLDARYSSVATQFKPNYAPVRELQTKINRTRRLLSQEIASVASGVRAEHAAALGKEKELQRELEKQKEFALGLNDAAVRYTILAREADTNRELYNAVLKRLKDVSLVADVHASRVSIVDAAVPPLASASPKTSRDLLTAGVFGVVAGVLLCFLLDYSDNRLKTPEEAQRYLRVPVLATIPNLKKLSGAVGSQQQLEHGTGADGGVALSYSGRSLDSEVYRSLRATLLLSRAGSPPKTIVITSAEPNEGKTHTAVYSAIVFAHTSSRVLLIDADLRRPSCHRMLTMKNHHGLSEALAGTAGLEEVIQSTSIASMFFLSSGKLPPNPAELLASEKMIESLRALSVQYDHIVIDTSPILRVSDALFLGAIADGTVVVVDAPATPKQHVKEALSRLSRARANVLGILFNKIRAGGFGYSYYTSYQYTNGYDASGRKSDENEGKLASI